MNESALTRVLHAAHAIEAQLEAELATAGLSLAKLGVLRALADEALTLGGLADCVRCVRSNITQLVDRLEADGLVRRVPDSTDRRAKRAELTAAGRRSHRAGVRIVERHEAAIASALGPDARALCRALDRLSKESP